MSIIIRLQNLPLSAKAADIREFFADLKIPKGAVNIVGGPAGDAFIGFSGDEDARLAMRLDGKALHGVALRLMLSSRREMESVISSAHSAQSTAVVVAAPAATAGGDGGGVRGSPHAHASHQSPAAVGSAVQSQGGWGGGKVVESPLASAGVAAVHHQQSQFQAAPPTSTPPNQSGQHGMGIDPQLQDWLHSQRFATPGAHQGGGMGNEALSPPIGSRPPQVSTTSSSSSLSFNVPPPNPPSFQQGQQQPFPPASTSSMPVFNQPPPSFGVGPLAGGPPVVLGDSWKAASSGTNQSGGAYSGGNYPSGQTSQSSSGFFQKPPPPSMGHQIQQVHQQHQPQKHQYQQQFVDRPAPVISQEFPSAHVSTMQPPPQHFTGPPPPIQQASQQMNAGTGGSVNVQTGSAGWGAAAPSQQRFNQPSGRGGGGNFGGPQRGQKRPFGAFQGPPNSNRGGGGGPPGRKFGRFNDGGSNSGPPMGGGRGPRFQSNPPQGQHGGQGFGAPHRGGGQFGSRGGFQQSRDGGGPAFHGGRGGGGGGGAPPRNFGDRGGHAPFQQQQSRPWQQQPPGQQPPQQQYQPGQNTGMMEKKRICVMITNVPFKATFNDIKNFVLAAGPHQKYEKITRTYYSTRNFSDKWIVEFGDDRDARAVMRSRTEINGRRLHCDYITPRDADEQYAIPEPEENDGRGGTDSGNRTGGGGPKRDANNSGRISRDHGSISPVRTQPFNHPPDPFGNADTRERRPREERKKSPDDGNNGGQISPTSGNIKSLASIVFEQRPPSADQQAERPDYTRPRRRSTSQERVGGGPVPRNGAYGDGEWRPGHYTHHLRGDISPIREPLPGRARRASGSDNGPASANKAQSTPIQSFELPHAAKELRMSSAASLDGSSMDGCYGGGALMIAADQSSLAGEGESTTGRETAMPGLEEDEEEYGEARMAPPPQDMPGLEIEESEESTAGNGVKDAWPTTLPIAPILPLPPITAFMHLAHLAPTTMTSLRLEQVPPMISADELATFLRVHIADPAANIARMTSGALYVNLTSEADAEKAVGRSGECIDGKAVIAIERISKREMAEAIAINEQQVASKLIEDRLKAVAVGGVDPSTAGLIIKAITKEGDAVVE